MMSKERRPLEHAELRALMRVGRPIDRAVLLTMYELALRAGELGTLRWEHVDMGSQGPQIKVARLKNEQVSWLPISNGTIGAVVTAFGGRPERGPMFRAWPQQRVRDWFRNFAIRAGLPEDKRYSHILRRSRATHLLQAGATLEQIQWLLGHKSVSSTIVYIGITEEAQGKMRVLATKGMERLL